MRRDRRSTRLPPGWLAKARAMLDAEPMYADLDDDGEADRLIRELDRLDGGDTEALIREADGIIRAALDAIGEGVSPSET